MHSVTELARKWNPELHPRMPKGMGPLSGSFIRKSKAETAAPPGYTGPSWLESSDRRLPNPVPGAAYPETPREVEALDSFTRSNGAVFINRYHLRGLGSRDYGDETLPHPNNSMSVKEAVREMDAIAARGSTERDTTVYRGIPDVWDEEDSPPGTLYTDPGFVSTAADRRWTATYAQPEDPDDPPFVATIRVPAGSPGMVGDDANYTEFVLPRNSTFRVVRYTDDGVVLDFVQ